MYIKLEFSLKTKHFIRVLENFILSSFVTEGCSFILSPTTIDCFFLFASGMKVK